MRKLLLVIILILASLHPSSALIITDVQVDTLSPASQGSLRVEITNDASSDVEEVSFSLDLSNLPFSSVGSSEDSVDEIQEDHRETFSFILRASPLAKSGDYNIPYTITYKGASAPKKGTIGVKIIASPEIEVTAIVDKPVINEKGKFALKIINKGRGDAFFVSLTVIPVGYTLLSEERVYIGSINSDDFETASFEVLFKSVKSRVNGILEYQDENNKKFTYPIDIPLTIYTKEKAIEIGIEKKDYTPWYIVGATVLLILWFIWRIIKKRRRLSKSMQLNKEK